MHMCINYLNTTNNHFIVLTCQGLDKIIRIPLQININICMSHQVIENVMRIYSYSIWYFSLDISRYITKNNKYTTKKYNIALDYWRKNYFFTCCKWNLMLIKFCFRKLIARSWIQIAVSRVLYGVICVRHMFPKISVTPVIQYCVYPFREACLWWISDQIIWIPKH